MGRSGSGETRRLGGQHAEATPQTLLQEIPDLTIFGLIQRNLGALGDKVMPFGIVGNEIIGLVNNVLNAVVEVRSSR